MMVKKQGLVVTAKQLRSIAHQLDNHWCFNENTKFQIDIEKTNKEYPKAYEIVYPISQDANCVEDVA